MDVKALFLNCTLKKSPHESNTQALIDKVAALLGGLGVATETVRVVDYDVHFGTADDEGHGDQWPLILDKIRGADIVVLATPLWLGGRSSVAQMVAERMDAITYRFDGRNQLEFYGKVAGTIVTGEGDGAQAAMSQTLYGMMLQGFTVPPHPDCYWVGEAGPGDPYLVAGGDRHLFTNERARYMAHNLAHFARLLKERPIPTDLKALQEEAKAVSRGEPTVPPRL